MFLWNNDNILFLQFHCILYYILLRIKLNSMAAWLISRDVSTHARTIGDTTTNKLAEQQIDSLLLALMFVHPICNHSKQQSPVTKHHVQNTHQYEIHPPDTCGRQTKRRNSWNRDELVTYTQCVRNSFQRVGRRSWRLSATVLLIGCGL